MSPTIVHRYSWSIREAIEALLGADAGDAERWEMRIDGDEVVVDIVAPIKAPALAPSDKDLAELPSNETARSNARDPESELKGGALARRAAIACGERGFWTFLGVDNADDAKADVCRRCGITTRKMLDHDERAGAIWNDIDGKYRLWLEGHDVELD